MHQLTEDERQIYRILRDTVKFAEVAALIRQDDARDAVAATLRGERDGAGAALLAELEAWTRLKNAAQLDLEAFLRKIFS